MVVVTDSGKLDELRERLKGRREGVVELRDVRTEARFDREGDEYVLLTLILSDPPAGSETWPLDDVYAVRSFARRAIAELGITSDVAIMVTAEGPSGTWEDEGGPLDDPRTALDEANGA